MTKHYCGEGIRYFRKLEEMKQDTLAENIGVCRQTLSDMERNKTKVDDDILAQIAEQLGTTPEQIKGYKKGIVINQNNQQMDLTQYNYCTVQVLSDTVETLQQALKACTDALQASNAQALQYAQRAALLEQQLVETQTAIQEKNP